MKISIVNARESVVAYCTRWWYEMKRDNSLRDIVNRFEHPDSERIIPLRRQYEIAKDVLAKR